MSLYEGSDDPGILPAQTPRFDRWDAQHRPASGTQSAFTSRQGPVAVPYASTKDARFRVNNGDYDNIKIGRQDDGTYSFIFNDGNNDVLLIGPDSSGTEVVKIAKPGFDAATAGPDSLVFNSNQNIFKIIRPGNFTTSSSYTSTNPGAGKFSSNIFTLAVIPHGLSFAPIVIGFLGDGSQYNLMPTSNDFSPLAAAGAQAFWSSFSISSDAANLYIYLNIMSFGGSTTFAAGFSFKYYLLQESAN